MKLNKILASIVAASLTSATALPALATELRMLSSWAGNQAYNAHIAIPFVEKVSELSGGEVSIRMVGPDVIPAFEQLEPVQSGLFDILFTAPAYHIGSASVALGIEGTEPDPELRRSSGIIDTMDEFYNGLGLKAIFVAPAGSKAFNFMLKEPVQESPSLAGKKIRGTQLYNPAIEGLGGAPVVMPMTDVYSALQTGVVDGAGTTLVGMLEQKWNEVAGFISRPVFGTVGLFAYMNLDTWESLSEDEQNVIMEAALEIEKESIARFDKLAAEEEATLLEQGVQITEMPEEDAARLDKLIADGAWETARSLGHDEVVDKMYQQAEEAGLLQ
ncbi:TRAP transporter substrate-binding protein [Halomonas sp. HK25]|uniref:TRAP transporter substrate-binding protein n=1 Tax=Halomonas sp. HK25 TaxID=3394321 RepID=UPI0039FBB199